MKPFYSSMSVSLVAIVLTGCAIGSKYERPAIELPSHFPEQKASSAISTPIDATWWTHFNDPVLNDLVQKGLAHNEDLHAAAARIENAEATLREVSGAMLPTVTAQTSSVRNRISQNDATPIPSTAPMTRNTHNASLATSFELDVFGKLRSATASAQSDLLATRYAHDSLKLSLIGSIAQQYFALRAYDSQLADLTALSTNRKHYHELVRARYEHGLASELDVQQSKLALATLDTQSATLRQQRALIEHQLALLTGITELHIQPGTLTSLVPPAPPSGLPSQLLENRPDIQQAEATLKSSHARVALAKAAYFPTISLTGNLGSESQSLSDLFNTGSNIWSLGLNTALTVFDAGRNTARKDEALATEHETLANYIKTIQTAFEEVNDALVTLHENTVAEQAHQQRIRAAQQSLQLTQYRYEAGYISQADVLNAEQNLITTRQDEIPVQQARLGATIALFKTLGGGWQKHQ